MNTAHTLALALLLPLLTGQAPSPRPTTIGASTTGASEPRYVESRNERLLAMEPFIGRWTAEGELAGGRRFTAERHYSWSLDKRYLRIEHTMAIDSVEVAEEMMIGWDPAEQLLRLWSFASDGSFAEGAELPAPGENRWIFEGSTVGGTMSGWRVTTFLTDPSSFSMLVEVRSNDGFTPVMTVAYQKVE